MTYLGLYADKARNPSIYPNAHKLAVTTIYKEMLKEEKEILSKSFKEKEELQDKETIKVDDKVEDSKN